MTKSVPAGLDFPQDTEKPEVKMLGSSDSNISSELIKQTVWNSTRGEVRTHIQAMRGVEATTRQLLIAARQVCSTVQGIHLSETKHTHKFQLKLQHYI